MKFVKMQIYMNEFSLNKCIYMVWIGLKCEIKLVLKLHFRLHLKQVWTVWHSTRSKIWSATQLSNRQFLKTYRTDIQKTCAHGTVNFRLHYKAIFRQNEVTVSVSVLFWKFYVLLRYLAISLGLCFLLFFRKWFQCRFRLAFKTVRDIHFNI